MSNGRRGTRISWEREIVLECLDPGHQFSETCTTMLVNPQGCAAKSASPLHVGAKVELKGLPVPRAVTARVVNCISLGEHERFWVLGLALDETGNVWGVNPEPEDWSAIPVPTVTETSSTAKVERSSRFLNFLRKATTR